MNTVWVGLCGALGCIARYHVGRLLAPRAPAFPWATLAVNLVGCLAISILMQLALRGRASDEARIAIGVGLLGGFTTYSSFNYETLVLLHAGTYARAIAYVVATLVGGVALGALGWVIGSKL